MERNHKRISFKNRCYKNKNNFITKVVYAANVVCTFASGLLDKARTNWTIKAEKQREKNDEFLKLATSINQDNFIVDDLDNDENEEFPFVEYFTADEYEEFKKRITEYPFLKEQIENSKEYLNAMEGQMEYFRNAYNKQLEMHETLIQSVKNFSDNLVQRNFIEAKDKGLDTDSKK